ncbi:IS3 family transposase [Streptomyces sp. ADMS]|uniref:IS3 family transposase n=1 Tax=Streptomyces sp. ADMS TaxID=3071415 RepID=UPI00296ECEA6|nr:IS3 family transposase [Streptomyces sp. ADMS]MDW4910444.1 IS3 family transposase [Streptomyces sp. ADMS]
MSEGCAVASVLGMLEEREAAARVQVESLREEVARLAEVLEAAEIELDRRVIARGRRSRKRRPHRCRCRARRCRPGGTGCSDGAGAGLPAGRCQLGWAQGVSGLATGEGWLYLATVIDCCTKEVIGYAMDDHYQTPLISRAIRNAARNRKLATGAIFHSDRGSNYMSAEFGKALDRLGLRRSSGRTGICFDNAMAESFFGALKNERVSRVSYLTREAARQDITRYIEFWYNRKRLHSAVGYRPPREVQAEYEKLRVAA